MGYEADPPHHEQTEESSQQSLPYQLLPWPSHIPQHTQWNPKLCCQTFNSYLNCFICEDSEKQSKILFYVVKIKRSDSTGVSPVSHWGVIHSNAKVFKQAYLMTSLYQSFPEICTTYQRLPSITAYIQKLILSHWPLVASSSFWRICSPIRHLALMVVQHIFSNNKENTYRKLRNIVTK